MDKHLEGFLTALNGGERKLDDWLECNNEKEVRCAIFSAIERAVEEEREACALSFESEASTWEALQYLGYLGSVKRLGAKAIRAREGQYETQ